MGILDDAIREHLDLKRRHGAREAELREIEDEAFGQGEQPDPFVGGELYSEVGATETAEAGNEEPTRLVEPEALRPSEPAPEEPELDTSDQPITTEPTIPGQVELPGQDEIPGQERLDEPESYQPTAEPESQPPTEEPESYRPAEDAFEETPEPPATSESLEELIAEEEPFPEDTGAPPPPSAPPEAEPEPEAEPQPESRPLQPQPDAEAPPEPESAVPDPPPPPPMPGTEPPGRARGRVDVPTQEHPPPGDTGDLAPLPGEEPELGRPDTSYRLPQVEEPSSTEEPISGEEPLPKEGAAPASDGPQLYDFETDEDLVPPSSASPAVEDDFEALGPAEEEAPYLDEEEPYPEEPASGVESGGEGSYEEPETAVRPALEEEEPYDEEPFDPEKRGKKQEGEEDLWFEKGPPKDFDFDD